MAVGQQPASVPTAFPQRTPWADSSLLQCALIFLVSFILLLLGMDRGVEVYDEGLILVGAMHVAAGQIPHRDFYANYGPGQFYILAWLFHWFGRSILVERLYDLALRAAIVTLVYGIAKKFCRSWIVASTTIVCGFWLFSAGLSSVAIPIVPILLISLAGAMVLLPVFQRNVSWQRMFAAGMLAGLVALFRYDVGIAYTLVLTLFIGIAALLRQRLAAARWRAAVSAMLPCWLGFALVFLPVALLYLAVAPVHPFIHDIFLYPTKYYVRARRLPFPAVHWRTFDRAALYLPLPVVGMVLYSLFARAGQEPGSPVDTEKLRNDQSQKGFLILFGLLTFAFYFKGLVRFSLVQMLLALVPMLLTLAVLYEYSLRRGRWLHRIVQWTIGVSILAATWSALKEVRVLRLNHGSVLQEALSGGPSSSRGESELCAAPALRTGLCFLMDPARAATVSYISQHTNPGETIFVGSTRHDRVAMNDLATYFAVNRLPATHWSHFDPDLQTRADIQAEMVRELDSQAVRYIVLEKQLEGFMEPSNDSSKSSGVTLLDDYIRNNYHQVAKFDDSSVWLRNGDPR
jgi:hypothetical protein